MPFKLRFTTEAREKLDTLAADPAHTKKFRKVRKTLGQLANNPRHPGLESHEYYSLTGPAGAKVWEVYVENRTPRAWRIWSSYGPERGELTIVSIGPNPD